LSLFWRHFLKMKFHYLMKKILKPNFFTRPTLQVAHDLLGKFLVRKNPFSGGVPSSARRGGLSVGIDKSGKDEIAVMITEVEVYDGPRDRASHASRGMTERNAIMFGTGGYFYVYLCYGMYEMLNIVTGSKNYPAAILFRGATPPPLGGGVRGGLINGPGKLTKFLKVDRRFNKKLAAKKTGLWFEDRGIKITDKMIKRTPRIGVAYAGPIWSKKKYRFLLTKPKN